FKRHLRGVHFVVGAVEQRHFHADRRIPAEHTALGSLSATIFHGRNVFAGDAALGNGIHEGEAILVNNFFFLGLLFGNRFDADRTIAELTATAGLLLVRSAHFGFARDGFTVSHTRPTDIHTDLHVTDQTVRDDFQVQFAHAGNDGLAGFFIV